LGMFLGPHAVHREFGKLTGRGARIAMLGQTLIDDCPQLLGPEGLGEDLGCTELLGGRERILFAREQAA